jgi:hypothetical protein
MLTRIVDWVSTDFFLVIQYDGFVLNSDLFCEEFYGCDYIGAPWPELDEYCVGNGGFSWRSRKLALAVKEIAFGVKIDDPEDVYICKTVRQALESRFHCNFASRELASLFSVEFPAVQHKTFGFHGVFHLPQIYAQNLPWLLSQLPSRMLRDSPASRLFEMSLSVISDEYRQAYRKMLTQGVSFDALSDTKSAVQLNE